MSQMKSKISFAKYDYFVSYTAPIDDIIILCGLEILEDTKIHNPEIFVKFRDIINVISPTHNVSYVHIEKIEGVRNEIINKMTQYQTNILSNKQELADFHKDTTPFRYSLYGKAFEKQRLDINYGLIDNYFDLSIALKFVDDIIEHIKEQNEINSLLTEATSLSFVLLEKV